MATRTPLVLGSSGFPEELPAGDTLGFARAGTPASSANVTGAVTPDFGSNLTLPMTCTGNVTSFVSPSNLADGETGELWIIPGAYTLPADPPSGAYKGNWDVAGTRVRIIIERIGSTYAWSADELEVVT